RVENNMATYNLLLHPITGLTRTEAGLRSLSLVFAVATVPMFAMLVDRLAGRPAAVVAGFAPALKPLALYYANELRAYSMVLFLVVAASLLLTRWTERRRPELLLAWAVVSALGAWTHYFAIWVTVAHVVALAALPDRRRTARQLAPALLGYA